MCQFDITIHGASFFPFEYDGLVQNYVSFTSFNEIKSNLLIPIENMELDFDDDDVRETVILNNPNSRLGLIDKTSRYFYFTRRSFLNISEVKYVSVRVKRGENNLWEPCEKSNIYWNSLGSFNIGDKCLYFSGKSKDYKNIYLDLCIVYAGRAVYQFEESEIVTIYMGDGYDLIKNEAAIINKEADTILMNTAQELDEKILNNIPSVFFEHEGYDSYFNCVTAIKNYSL